MNNTTIAIAPLSVNRAYKGRKFPTPRLTAFKREMHYLLPNSMVVPEGKLQIAFVFGISTKLSDLDNLVKSTLDCIAEKYNFDDVQVYKITAEKKCVKKGNEYIEFCIGDFGQ